MDLLLKAWRDAADYTSTLSMDEKGYKTKSRRVPGKQRNVAKPARYFMKGFAIAASDSPIRGYVYNIKMYGGKGDGGDCADGAKVSYITRCITQDMQHNNLTLVYDNYYGGETPLLKLLEMGIESVCTVNKNAVSHVFEKRDTSEVYKSGKKEGEAKLSAALQPGEYRTAVWRPCPTHVATLGRRCMCVTARCSRVAVALLSADFRSRRPIFACADRLLTPPLRPLRCTTCASRTRETSGHSPRSSRPSGRRV